MLAAVGVVPTLFYVVNLSDADKWISGVAFLLPVFYLIARCFYHYNKDEFSRIQNVKELFSSRLFFLKYLAAYILACFVGLFVTIFFTTRGASLSTLAEFLPNLLTLQVSQWLATNTWLTLVMVPSMAVLFALYVKKAVAWQWRSSSEADERSSWRCCSWFVSLGFISVIGFIQVAMFSDVTAVAADGTLYDRTDDWGILGNVLNRDRKNGRANQLIPHGTGALFGFVGMLLFGIALFCRMRQLLPAEEKGLTFSWIVLFVIFFSCFLNRIVFDFAVGGESHSIWFWNMVGQGALWNFKHEACAWYIHHAGKLGVPAQTWHAPWFSGLMWSSITEWTFLLSVFVLQLTLGSLVDEQEHDILQPPLLDTSSSSSSSCPPSPRQQSSCEMGCSFS
jgi:hypothetical protein